MADPPEETVTLVGLSVAVTPVGGNAVKLTVPENPPMLVTVIVTLCVLPANILPKFDGFAERLKSAVAWAGMSPGTRASRLSNRTVDIRRAVLISII